ncbi:MAG: OprO/OprP family phosphate-selective porin [Gammaproteobacteria bacterium]
MNKSTKVRFFGAVLAGCAVALAASGSVAGGGTMQELLKVLKEQGTISQEAYDKLSDAAKEEAEKAQDKVSKVAKEEAEKTAKSQLPEFNKKGKLEFVSPDEKFSFEVFGRLQTDAAWYWDDDNTHLDSSAEFRRARLGIGGTLWDYWIWKFETDFTEDRVSIKDAYIRNTYLNPFAIQVGNFKEPFSLEQLTSSRFITFMERSINDDMVPERNLGAMVQYIGPSWTASGGVFGEGIDNVSETLRTSNGGEGIGATGRITVAPILAEDRLLHLGGAISWRKPDEPDSNAADDLRIRARPESHVTDVRLVDTGTIAGVEHSLRYGAEAAFAWGPWSLQGEYIYFDIDRQTGADPNFDGWYFYGSWFLTGESRAAAYKVDKGGVFDRIKPLRPWHAPDLGGRWGAFELAARYSTIDLTDAGINGGEEDNFTAALNWYPNANLRLMLNYIRVLDVERPGNAFDGAEPDLVQIRAQVDW